jgi:group I intron endonuclease
MVVYLVTNKATGKQYVGQTVKHPKKRWWEHLYWGTCKNPKSRFGYLHKAIQKYKPEAFVLEVLHQCSSKEEMDFVETFYISLLNTKAPAGYNLTDGGEGTHGRVCSEETREKIRKKALGRSFSDEVNARKGRKGRKLPPRNEEWCRKISENATKRMSQKYGPNRTLWKGKRRIDHGK